MAPKPPPEATNKEPASSSKTKTDSARSEQKAAKSSSAAKAAKAAPKAKAEESTAAPKAKAEDPKSKEKEKKKVKKANGKDSARESTAVEESAAVEEPVAAEVSLEVIPESAEAPMAEEPAAEELAAPEPPVPEPPLPMIILRRVRIVAEAFLKREALHKLLSGNGFFRAFLANCPLADPGSAPLAEGAADGANLLHDRQFKKLLLEAFAANWAAHLLCRAWKRTREIRGDLVREGKLAVILVANLGTGGSRPAPVKPLTKKVAAAKAEKEAAAKAKEEAKRLKDETIAKKKKPAKGAKGDKVETLFKVGKVEDVALVAAEGEAAGAEGEAAGAEDAWAEEAGAEEAGAPASADDMTPDMSTKEAAEKEKVTAEVRQKHIHTTVRHAGQRATFLIANEYDWGSRKDGKEGPGGTDKRVQRTLGFTLTTEEAACKRCSEMRCSCWRYAQETQVSNKSGFYSIPGVEGGTFNIIATRQAGAFVLEKMPTEFYKPSSEFYKGLPNEAYEGRFLCAKATQRDPPGHSFLLATWHGQNTHNVKNPAQVAVVKQLCEHLRRWCDENEALCCLFAGDFNIELQPGYDPKEFGGFKRLDPDENVRSQCAGRRRNGNRQNDIDHMLFYPPEVLPLMARRPRRFRMYDRQSFGLLPRRQECRDAGHCSCSEATPPDQACAGAVTHKLDGALDHDGLILELWLDGNSTSSKASLDAIIVDRMSREGTYVEGEIELMAAANAFNVFQPAYNQSTLASRAVAVAAEAARAARTRAYRAAWSVPPDVEVAEAAAQAAEEAAAIVVKEADLAKRAAETAERAAETALATVTAGAERADWETRKGWVDYYTVRNLSWVRRYTREAAEDARDARAAARRVAA
jgi:hypothetical protein